MSEFRDNYSYANRVVAKIMMYTFYILTVVCIFNQLGIFILDKKMMHIGYLCGAVCLLTPTLLLSIYGADNKIFSIVFIALGGLLIIDLALTVTYHVIIMYVYPIALAALYFRKRLMFFATMITSMAIAGGETGAFLLNPYHDKNFTSLKSVALYDVLPKEMCLVAIAILYFLLTDRTSFMLKSLNMDAKKMKDQHDDMVMGFATLVEGRDNSTGSHIRRTSKYVELILHALKAKGIYTEFIDDDFIDNMVKAAPLHDIGKISTPDAILQKPGKLTAEEFEIMKEHSTKGREMISQLLSNSENEAYRKMAENVAGFHHEKWNGKGYPLGLADYQIPLSARIMAVADVFDAVSQNRCYRVAMPLEKCFQIIEEGRGTDFDPEIVEVFMEYKDEVIKIHQTFYDEDEIQMGNVS